MELVYKVNKETDNGVFADRDRALYVAQLYDALCPGTWAEFRSSLPEGGWEEFLERFGAYENDGDSGEPVDDYPRGNEPIEGDCQRPAIWRGLRTPRFIGSLKT
jgi:hypothetical protein